MEVADYILESWTTNQLYNAIYNCKAVKPPYEEEWFYNNEFYLDKREGLTYSNQLNLMGMISIFIRKVMHSFELKLLQMIHSILSMILFLRESMQVME